MVKVVLEGASEEQKTAIFDLSLSAVRNSKLSGFAAEDEFAIRTAAEQHATAILTARIKPAGGS